MLSGMELSPRPTTVGIGKVVHDNISGPAPLGKVSGYIDVVYMRC